MATERYTRLYEKINQALLDQPKQDALYSAMKGSRDKRRVAIENRPTKDAFRQEVRQTKLRSIARMDELVEQFAENCRKRGTIVFIANDGKEAIDYTLKIIKERGAKTVAKSKSLTTEEIHINHPMEEAGVKVIETDLGELIIQLVHEKPYHLVFPAVHKTAQEVADIFKKELGEDIPSDPKIIMQHVRKYLRPIFLNADIGMTGANVGIAETGTIVIETNEGNARMVSSIPDCHICVMGMEKIVSTIEEALEMTMAHPISAIGQLLTTYNTFMSGRSPLGEDGAPRESHIIVLDNGRHAMREDPVMSDALNCIRCGACMNICPTYGVVGGHTFGYVYPGPIGIPWTASVHGLDHAGDFAPLCISCGLCKEICPAEIDIPMMIAEVKHRDMEKNPQPAVNRLLMDADRMSRLGSMTAPFSNWFMRNSAFRWVMEKTQGIDRTRPLPKFSRNTLAKWHKRHYKKTGNETRKVVYFTDLFALYHEPELGIATVRALQAAGCEVELYTKKSSGYPFIGYGDLTRAKNLADEICRDLQPFIEQGYDIIATEPTAAYCLKISYKKLLDKRNDAKAVAEHTYEIFEYLNQVYCEDKSIQLKQHFASLQGKKFGFHLSCHQRPISAAKPTMEWLRRCGADVELIETGTCCGMGGTFGMKAGPLGVGLSKAVGAPLFQLFKDSGVEAVLTESSVCTIQLLSGLDLPVYHPLQLLMSEKK